MRNLIISSLILGLVIGFCLSVKAGDESLVLYLSFDEGAGEEVKDLSGHENHGTLQGLTKPKWVDGKSGKALSYDGQGYVEVPHDDSLSLTGPHTISYWLKWGGTGLSWSPFISKTAGSDPADNYHTWIGSDKMWDYANGNKRVNANTPIELDSNNWVFLTVTHDGTQVHFYANGKLDVSQELGTWEANEASFLVGDDGKGNFGNGTLDELLVFNRALTAEEVVLLMEKGAQEFLAVEHTGKLPITWGCIKR